MQELVTLAVPMARAMAYAHSSGVIHRDFKPDNVILADGSVPKVMDFGIAKLARQAPQLTQTPPAPRQHVPELPAAFEALVLEMLAKEPSARPADMEAVASRLESIGAGRVL